MPDAPPNISVVILSRNEGSNLRRTVETLAPTLPDAAEMVVVDDGSSDGSADFVDRAGCLRRHRRRLAIRLVRSRGLGVAKGRNLGARHSSGDVIVFADAHVDVDEGWWQPMLDLLRRPRVGAVGPVISSMADPECKGYGLEMHGPDPSEEWLVEPVAEPRPVPLLGGCFLAMRRDTFEATGGFDPGMTSWGMNDNEISLRLWLLGYELWLAPQVDVRHLFRERHPYRVKWSGLLHNKLRMAHVHFGPQRRARVEEALRRHEDFPAARDMLRQSDVARRRRQVHSQRSRDDDWYFGRFGPQW